MWKATNKTELFSDLQIIHRSRIGRTKGLISTHKGLEKIGDIVRFKKSNSSKDYVEEFRYMLYTSQDPNKRFYFPSYIMEW